MNSCSKTLITIEAAATEIGSALLADAEHLLDHAAEHQATIHDLISNNDWYSPAWTLVTTYYWSFFSALTLSRLAGQSVWFLDRPAVEQLKLLSSATQRPGAGAMYLRVGAFVSGTNREVSLRPSGKQLHDAVWLQVSNLVDDILAHSNQLSNQLEFRLWWSLGQICALWGPAWPSAVRNQANYRPGYAYREVIKAQRIDTMKHMRSSSPSKFEDLVEALEDEAIAIRSSKVLLDSLATSSRTLGVYARILAAVTSQLHTEVVGRHSGDARWRALRNSFYKARCGTTAGSTWPFLE